MYKINKSYNEILYLQNEHFKLYKDKVREVIQDFLDSQDRAPLKKTLGRTDKISLTFKIKKGSITETFLNKCPTDDRYLRKVLAGTINDQLSLIQEVINSGGERCLKSITKDRALRVGWNNQDTVDDFNTIVKEIFVTRLFDCKNLNDKSLSLDKDKFVKDLGLRICPYCGRAYIYRVEKDGKDGRVSVKPQIDHFLPKSAYPFIALNFLNLIPCCTQCNMSPCKVNNDPLDGRHHNINKLMHPYLFDGDNILFRFGLKTGDLFDPANYSVGVGYSTKEYKKGYNDFLAIDKLYAEHGLEVCNMFGRAEALHAATNNFYRGVGVTDAPFSVLSYAILGYALNVDEESRQLLYKFKKDILLQMYNAIPTGRTYFYDWEGKEGIFNT